MNRLLLDNAEKLFREHGLDYSLTDMGTSGKLLVLERGGRILPFFRDGEEYLCALWTNPDIDSSAGLNGFLERRDWNLGGERLWIAPEMQYSIRDRENMLQSYLLPEVMDPGNYRLSEELPSTGRASVQAKTAVLKARFELEAYNFARGKVTLETERRVRPVANPLRELSSYESLMDGISCAAEHRITSKIRTESGTEGHLQTNE